MVNVARGAVLDQAALARTLRDGHLGGAGLDVLAVEPPPSTDPILAAPNVILSPHFAWSRRRPTVGCAKLLLTGSSTIGGPRAERRTPRRLADAEQPTMNLPSGVSQLPIQRDTSRSIRRACST